MKIPEAEYDMMDGVPPPLRSLLRLFRKQTQNKKKKETKI